MFKYVRSKLISTTLLLVANMYENHSKMQIIVDYDKRKRTTWSTDVLEIVIRQTPLASLNMQH